jgi:hypothetical protein
VVGGGGSQPSPDPENKVPSALLCARARERVTSAAAEREARYVCMTVPTEIDLGRGHVKIVFFNHGVCSTSTSGKSLAAGDLQVPRDSR